jgi:hypothetical protein
MTRGIVVHVIDKIIIVMYIIFLLVNWYIVDAIIYKLINHNAIILSSFVSWLFGFIWLINFIICYYIILLLLLNMCNNNI